MKKQEKKWLISAAATVAALGISAAIMPIGFADDYTVGTVPDAAQQETLLSAADADDRLLGVASYFSVFVENDFGANGSDCEGRLAAGGAANHSDMTPHYHVGMEFADYASEVAMVIVGEGPISNFTFTNEAAVVIGADMPDENIQLENTPMLYRADLIDFDAEFAYLRDVSAKLGAMTANGYTETGSWAGEVRFVGEGDADLYVWNFTAEEWAALFNPYGTFFDFIIPEGSHALINISGDSVAMPMMTAGVAFNGDRIDGNDAPGSERILYNLYEATSFTYEGIGTFYGSVLAPNADGSDDMTEGAHVSGQTIAKSYEGGIQFGYTFFDASVNLISQEEETTTTTTETTTTTTETTTTTTETTTTTTETTTTTTETTTTTTETTTTTTETTTTTTETTTTTTETTTTTTETTTTTTETTTTTTETTTTTAETTTTTTETTTTTAETTTTEATSSDMIATSENGTTTTTTSSSVQTGDRAPIALMFAGMAALGTAIILRRKRD